MTISYRTRLALIAAFVASAVIAATLALMWTNVRKVEGERLDSRLCIEARRLASRPFSQHEFDRLAADIAQKLRIADTAQLLLRIEPNAAPVAQSMQWPTELSIDTLRWAPLYERKDERAPEPTAPRHPSSDDHPERLPPPASGERPPQPPPPPNSAPRANCAVASFAKGNSEWRVAVVAGSGGRGFVAADVAAAAEELLGEMRSTLPIVIPIAAALVALGAWLLSAVSMRPISRLREAMKTVDRKDMSRRLSPVGEDREFQELIGAYNTMLERLQASFEQASRFSADAAHELRTPLTILQGRLEEAIRKSEGRAIQADLTDTLEELGRLAAVTRKLLLLSQADAGPLALSLARVDVKEILEALVTDARMLASGQVVSSAIDDDLVVRADALLLRQLLNNLISNAVRYALPGGRIEISGRGTQAGIEVTIANSSEPISVDDRGRFFDRFYRRDPARNRRSEGTGLGLSLAREIARAHGGDLTLEPGPPDEVRLRLSLPRE